MIYIKATDRLPLISSNDVVVIWRGRKYIASYNATGQYFSGDFGCLSAHNSDWEGVKWLDENDDCNQKKRKEALSFAPWLVEVRRKVHFKLTWGIVSEWIIPVDYTDEQLYDLYLQSLTT